MPVRRSPRTKPPCAIAWLLLGGGLMFFSAVQCAIAAEDADLAAYYGFGPLEIFKLERRSHSMLPGDFNHDGRQDLAIVDNSHSRIDLLLQRDRPPDGAETLTPRTVNEISSHWRFEHVKIPVDRNISAMAVGDFNGDDQDDLAYFGDPDRLILRFQSAAGEWNESRQMRLADVEGQAWGIAAGDLNNDGRDDVAVLGKKVTYLILQSSPGEFSPPKEIRNTAERLGLAMIGDLDGDRRSDLFYIATDGNTRRASTRLQNEAGHLGPEIRFDLRDTRGLVLFDLVEGAGREVVTIDGTTGRMRVAQFAREGEPEGELSARLVQYGFGEQASKSGRDLAAADLNGDGLIDVVVTDPNAAQLIVFLQHPGYGLDLGTPYPSFLGVEQVRAADIDGDGVNELFVLSNKEKSIGQCRFENDRVTFPTALPITGEPVAFEVADLDRDGRSELYYLEKLGRKEYSLHRLSEAGGEWTCRPVGDGGGKLNLPNEPGHMLAIDANLDRRTDLLLADSAGRAPALLVTSDEGVPQLVETSGGLQLGNLDRGAVFSGMLTDRVTLVAQENFARNLRLDDQNRWQVLDQYNPGESGAKIAGVATLDLDGEPGNELVLVDTGVNKLRVMRKEGQLYQPWEQIDIGTFPFIATSVADLNNDQRDDLVVFGAQRFLTVYAGQPPPVLKDVMTFESRLRNVLFADLVAGDLNSDGNPDVAMFDITEHHIEIVTRRGDKLVHAMSFKVFEEKNFGRRSSEGPQPREAVIADVTGDGRNDLVLLVHDRVLVYPQDGGPAGDEQATQAARQTAVGEKASR